MHGIFDLSYLHVDGFRMILGFWLVTSWHFGQPMLKKDDGRWLLRITQNVSRVSGGLGSFYHVLVNIAQVFLPNVVEDGHIALESRNIMIHVINLNR